MNPHDDERGLRIVAGGNRFAFTTMIRERAHDLSHGAAPQILTASTKAVSIAIIEASHGRTTRRIAPRHAAPSVVLADDDRTARNIVCQDCGVLVVVRRKGGVPVRGRPPTRCASHGLSDLWEQLS